MHANIQRHLLSFVSLLLSFPLAAQTVSKPTPPVAAQVSTNKKSVTPKPVQKVKPQGKLASSGVSFKARSFGLSSLENNEPTQWKSSWRLGGGLGFSSLQAPLINVGAEWIPVPGQSVSFFVATTLGASFNPASKRIGWSNLQSQAEDGTVKGLVNSFQYNNRFIGAKYNARAFGSWAYSAGLAIEQFSYSSEQALGPADGATLPVSGQFMQLDALASLGNRWRLFGTVDLGVDWLGLYLPLARINENFATAGVPAGILGLQEATGGTAEASRVSLPKAPTLMFLQTQVSVRF